MNCMPVARSVHTPASVSRTKATLTRKPENGNLNPEMMEMDWLQTTCRAGAIVLLVGFWFDGGLLKLATAATFWILLELGSVQPRMDTNKHE